jgi:transposase
MFVDSSKSVQRGKTYVRHLLRDSYRDKADGRIRHHTLANLSHCSEAEIAAIKLALANKENLATLGNIQEIKSKQGLRIGLVYTLKTVAERVGLTKALGPTPEGKLALWQVMARFIDQGSRLSAVRLAESHATCDLLGLEAFNEDHLYNNLAWLSKHQEAIEKRLFRKHYGHTPPQLFLYDVSSTYLEGMHNILAAFGYNRDRKKGKPQLVFGLLTGPDGTPVAVRVFAGNTTDGETVAEQVRILVRSFGVEGVTLVGDRGMLKQPQIAKLNEAHFHYITAITKPQIRTLLKEGVFQLGLFEDNICEVASEGVRYILRRNPERAGEIAANREDKLSSVNRFLSQKNSYLAEHPRARVKVAQREIDTRIKKLDIENWVKTVSQDSKLTLEIDEAARRELAELDGCYVIKTDLPVAAAIAETIHERYKDLALVEQAFRTFKRELLEVQPTYVRTEASTRGHVFVVMLAYLLERELNKYWHGLELTKAECIDRLGSLCGIEMELGQQSYQTVPEATGDCKKLLDAANIKLPPILPLTKTHVATRKKLVPTRN